MKNEDIELVRVAAQIEDEAVLEPAGIEPMFVAAVDRLEAELIRTEAAIEEIVKVLGPYSPLEVPSMAEVLNKISDIARNALNDRSYGRQTVQEEAE